MGSATETGAGAVGSYEAAPMRVGAAFVQTLGTQLVQTALSLTCTVIIARALGPAGQGRYATIAAAVTVWALLGALGQFQGSVLAAATGRVSPNALLLRATIQSLAVGVAGWIASPLWREHVGQPRRTLVILVLALIASEVFMHCVRGIALGVRRIGTYNMLMLAQRVVVFAAIVPLALRRLTLVGALGAWLVANLVSSFIVAARLVDRRGAGTRWSDGLGASVAAGGRALFATAAGIVLVRCDYWVVAQLLGAASVGQLSVAAGLAEWLWYVPTVANNVLFAAGAAATQAESERATARATRLMTGMMIVVATTLALVGPLLIDVLYGGAYAAAPRLFLFVLPGAAAIAIHLVVDAYFAGRGFPVSAMTAASAAVAIKVILLYALVPRLGLVGAALASSIAYAILLGWKCVLLIRGSPQLTARSLLVMTRADLVAAYAQVRTFARVVAGQRLTS